MWSSKTADRSRSIGRRLALEVAAAALTVRDARTSVETTLTRRGRDDEQYSVGDLDLDPSTQQARAVCRAIATGGLGAIVGPLRALADRRAAIRLAR
jgi:hypothetical protein